MPPSLQYEENRTCVTLKFSFFPTLRFAGGTPTEHMADGTFSSAFCILLMHVGYTVVFLLLFDPAEKEVALGSSLPFDFALTT